MQKGIFKDSTGKRYTIDELKVYFSSLERCEFFIGTDSQDIGNNNIAMVSCICTRIVDDTGKLVSSRIFHNRYLIERKEFPTVRAKIMSEGYRSLELAMELESSMNGRISIHLDVSDNAKNKSSVCKTELMYLMKSQGYDVKIKPDSWASSSVADRLSK